VRWGSGGVGQAIDDLKEELLNGCDRIEGELLEFDQVIALTSADPDKYNVGAEELGRRRRFVLAMRERGGKFRGALTAPRGVTVAVEDRNPGDQEREIDLLLGPPGGQQNRRPAAPSAYFVRGGAAAPEAYFVDEEDDEGPQVAGSVGGLLKIVGLRNKGKRQVVAALIAAIVGIYALTKMFAQIR